MHEINIFAFVLVVQSLPFLSAVAIALIEGTRLNSFAYLARHRGQDRRPPATPQVIAEPPKLPAENRMEAAQ